MKKIRHSKYLVTMLLFHLVVVILCLKWIGKEIWTKYVGISMRIGKTWMYVNDLLLCNGDHFIFTFVSIIQLKIWKTFENRSLQMFDVLFPHFAVFYRISLRNLMMESIYYWVCWMRYKTIKWRLPQRRRVG